jgi:hypothetical protein
LLFGRQRQTKKTGKPAYFGVLLNFRVAILFATAGECKMIVVVWGVRSAKIVLVGEN